MPYKPADQVFNRPPRPPGWNPEPEPPRVDDADLTVVAADLLADGPLTPLKLAQGVLAEGYRANRTRWQRAMRTRRVCSEEFIAAGVRDGWWVRDGGRLRLPEGG